MVAVYGICGPLHHRLEQLEQRAINIISGPRQHRFKDDLGIHARPAGMWMGLPMNYHSELPVANQSDPGGSLKKISTNGAGQVWPGD
ncbi:hypothetical protein ACL2XP_08535 [Sodalis sp. RH21]|uniref:hypothetical protein n=1 Tax=unclassified Sodalis (in: enterobacteria) TaxID=2636512 RepID=UPI0039B5ABE3